MAGAYLLAVLCAGWCSSCERFRPDYLGPALDAASEHRLWIDIEDDADVLPDNLDVAALPMLLVAASPHQATYFGPVRPNVQVVRQLAHLQSGTDPAAGELLECIVRRWLHPA
jgi:thioredoxin 1